MKVLNFMIHFFFFFLMNNNNAIINKKTKIINEIKETLLKTSKSKLTVPIFFTKNFRD